MDDVIGQRAYNKLDAGRQCTAMSKTTGERCKRAPIVGGFVCDHHGGKIPAVQKAARERLLAMVDPALDALRRALRTGPPCEHCGRSDADRDPVVLRSAQLVFWGIDQRIGARRRSSRQGKHCLGGRQEHRIARVCPMGG